MTTTTGTDRQVRELVDGIRMSANMGSEWLISRAAVEAWYAAQIGGTA